MAQIANYGKSLSRQVGGLPGKVASAALKA